MLEKNLRVNIKRDKNANYLMTTTCAVKNHYSKRFKQLRSSDVMATQVNSSFLRTENKEHTTSFLRCRGVQ